MSSATGFIAVFNIFSLEYRNNYLFDNSLKNGIGENCPKNFMGNVFFSTKQKKIEKILLFTI